MIPFNKVSLLSNEVENVEQAVRSGTTSGEGNFGRKCEELLKNKLDNLPQAVLLTPSCTSALEMCALLLQLREGDEVIMPSYTFVTTASAFSLRGARPVFVDVDTKNLNITAEGIEQAITERTKAIVVVHYAGVACQMDRILKIATDNKLILVEDAAHALGGKYKGQPLGTFGHLSTFSFHETKNITCGEGGALVVNDPQFVDHAYIIRDKGTNRRDFLRHTAAFYTWVALGSSYVMSDILGGFLFAQLENLEKINNQRRAVHRNYQELLIPLKEAGCLEYSEEGGLDESTAHLFYVIVESRYVRDKLIKYLKEHGVSTVFHYQPLHKSPYIEGMWGVQEKLPVTEDLHARLLRLPMFYSLSEQEQEIIAEQMVNFFEDELGYQINLPADGPTIRRRSKTVTL